MTATTTAIPVQAAPQRRTIRIVWPRSRKRSQARREPLKAVRRFVRRTTQRFYGWMSRRSVPFKLFVMFGTLVIGWFASFMLGYLIALPFALLLQAIGLATAAYIAYELLGAIVGLTIGMLFTMQVEPLLDF